MHMIPRKKCIPSNITLSDINVYDSVFKRTEKSFESVFEIVPGLMRNELFLKNSFRVSIIAESYLNEDGNLYIEFPNTYRRWFLVKTDSFCVEMISKRNTRKPIFMADVEIENFNKITVNNVFALAITTGFLVLTILPYCLLPRLRDYNGLILILFLVLFIMPFAIRLHLISSSSNVEETLTTGIIIYFSFTSSICWTNIMFYRVLNLERNFSSGDLIGTLETRKVPLLKYCIYAFGLPLLLTLLVIGTEIFDMKHVRWFVTPKIVQMNTMLVDGSELLYYLYIPISLLLLFNWIICITNVIRFYKKTKVFPKSVTGNYQKILKSPLSRTAQYVKLLVLLTVFLVLKVVAILSPDTDVNYDTHYYFVMCIGPVIFVTFVIDKSVWEMTKELLAKCKDGFLKFKSIFYVKSGDITSI
ncbi:unnamed protein product [Arctia plantaginis]|uniref:G-protein coupled receptors family 2 profile 2 domain-containing protein n=1 Tax=Arctia plantaginis TaxID=874455 RepID=A0A8S0Z5S7_ARCPL|nr:unnamed protein product [Arctia plantaginis]